jgi:hypothetical protein
MGAVFSEAANLAQQLVVFKSLRPQLRASVTLGDQSGVIRLARR